MGTCSVGTERYVGKMPRFMCESANPDTPLSQKFA